MENFFETCGYLATFMGTLLEGEISLLTAALSAKLGLFNYPGAMAAGFLGAYVADWFKFFVSKKQGNKLLNKKTKLKERINRSTKWFDKNPLLILIFYKFLFGFTTIILLMSGLKDISYIRFSLLSAISIGLWVLVLGGFGYYCAEAMITKINYIGMHKFKFIGALVLIALAYWFFVKRPKNKYCFECKED